MAIHDANLQEESRERYLTYALSVVSARALPDVRDGLKPVQRRILYTMFQQLRLLPSASHRKCAAVIGAVLARYHPHGDIACYEALARMAQDFSLRYPLVDGQGNFGSIDGDSPAAYRYTEARLTEMALEVIGEINEDTVDYRDNFDATAQEPVVLASRVPNLLINGAAGIAVGMATSIPPHNLRDTIKAVLELAEDPDVSDTRLVTVLKGPDFPTGCLILNTRKELNELYRTGRGAIRMRSEWELEDGARGKQLIIITAVPYALNKGQLIEKIANLIITKKVPQLIDVRDESTDKVRVVLELASGADPQVAMAYLFKHTQLETSFPMNLTALVPCGDGGLRPELLSLKVVLQHFIDFRIEVVTRRLRFERKQHSDRIHILEGLQAIYDALDEALKIVRSSSGRADAAQKLRKRFKLSERQAFAVVDMRIYQLSKTNIAEVEGELKKLTARVKQIDQILKSKVKLRKEVCAELEGLARKFGDARRCRLLKDKEEIEIEFREDDYVVDEEIYAIVTREGWIKRIRQSNDVEGTRIREGDQILKAHPISTRDLVMFITNLGYAYVIKGADFPASSGYGDPVQKHFKFRDGEAVVDSLVAGTLENAPDYAYAFGNGASGIALVTKSGTGFIVELKEVTETKKSGRRIMKLRADDKLAAISVVRGNVLGLFTKQGSGLLVACKEIPVKENPVVGVALMGIRSDDELAGAVCASAKNEVRLQLESGRDKVLKLSELLRGRRGLKGRKVISRGSITGVKLEV